MRREADTLADGSPEYLPHIEGWLVGAAMIADLHHVQAAAAVVTPDDFRDPTLGNVWAVLPSLPCTSVPVVAEALWSNGDYDAVGGEPRLVELAGAEGAFLYSAPVFILEHARIIHEWGDKRRRLRELSEEAKAVYEGRASDRAVYANPAYRSDGF